MSLLSTTSAQQYSTGENELYDLEADPYELKSIYESADPSLIQDLKARLDELRSCTGEGCREAELSRVSLIQRFFDLFEKS